VLHCADVFENVLATFSPVVAMSCDNKEVFMSMPKLAFTPLKTGACLALPALLLPGISVAEASNLNFLNDTPMSYIKKADIDSIKRALIEVLNKKKDGETTRWTNVGTGNSVKIDATMIPESTDQEGKKTCRRVSIVLNAKGQSMNLHPKFCGTTQADWTLQKR
jgi:hypothetical protein